MLSLLQCGVPSTGYSPSQTAPTLVLPTGFSSSRTALLRVFSIRYSPAGTDYSTVGPQWDMVSARNTAPTRALHWLQILSRHIYLLQCGVLHGLQGCNLLCHGLLHGLQGTLGSGTWSLSFPFFFTEVFVCIVVSLTLLSLSHSCCGLFFTLS